MQWTCLSFLRHYWGLISGLQPLMIGGAVAPPLQHTTQGLVVARCALVQSICAPPASIANVHALYTNAM